MTSPGSRSVFSSAAIKPTSSRRQRSSLNNSFADLIEIEICFQLGYTCVRGAPHMKKPVFFLSLLIACVFPAVAQTDADRDAIKRTALNYAEGWYEGNADKMES